MKLKEYIKELNTLVALHPEVAEYEVIYAHDDEGNEFQKVNCLPSLMLIDNIDDDRYLEIQEVGEGYNAICIN
jgi:hypothetical protein